MILNNQPPQMETTYLRITTIQANDSKITFKTLTVTLNEPPLLPHLFLPSCKDVTVTRANTLMKYSQTAVYLKEKTGNLQPVGKAQDTCQQ